MSSKQYHCDEIEKRAAVGVIRASRFIRRYSRSNKPINIDIIKRIHKEIFIDAWPDIAGKYRIEDLRISGSKLLPPHYSQIGQMMQQADKDLSYRMKEICKECTGIISFFDAPDQQLINCIDQVVSITAWLHHKITYIHPFREGNGRTARLAANLILERYGLVGISVKIERENKNKYCEALSQIDNVNDYKPLKKLIFAGLSDRYSGVNIKYYSASK